MMLNIAKKASFAIILFISTVFINGIMDVVMASAARDRILHRCTVVNIRGESYRSKETRAAAKETGVRVGFSYLVSLTSSLKFTYFGKAR